jgi:hypothetical protein
MRRGLCVLAVLTASLASVMSAVRTATIQAAESGAGSEPAARTVSPAILYTALMTLMVDQDIGARTRTVTITTSIANSGSTRRGMHRFRS